MPPQRIDLYDEIGLFGVSAQRFCEQLRAAGDQDIELHINSPGGDVFEGFAIANALKMYKGKKIAVVDALCASAATFAAMVCDELHMHQQSMLMVHDPWSLALGNAEDLESQAQVLRSLTDLMVKLYQDKSGADEATVRAMLTDETWLTPEQAKAAKFCDAIIDRTAPVDARAMARFAAKFKNPPAQFRAQAAAKPSPPPAPQKSPTPPQRNPIAMDRKQIVAGLASALAMAFEYAQAGADSSDQELQAASREILAAERLPACSGLIMPLAQEDGADVSSEQARSMVGVYALAQELTGQREGVAGALEALGKNAKSKTSVATASLDVQVEQAIQAGIKACKLTSEDGRAWRVAIASGRKTLADLKAFVKVALPAAENASGEETHGARQGGDEGEAGRPVSDVVKNLTDWDLV